MITKLEGTYKSLSNYFEAPIEFKGITYRSNVVAFYAQFFDSEVQKRTFRNLLPNQAKILYNKFHRKELSIEEQLQIMHDICVTKFNTYPEIKDILMKSEGKIYNNTTWENTFWGITNSMGENHTGKILEQIREEFKEEVKKEEKKSKKKKETEEKNENKQEGFETN